MKLYDQLVDKILHGHNPYAGFPISQWAGTWFNDGGAARLIFGRTIEKVKPALIVEVGSFVGESAIHMAKCLKPWNPNGVILCVDTWMGGIDHWEKRPQDLRFWFGRPSLYYQFIGNVMKHGVQDMIVPLSLDSLNAARLLKLLKIQPDMVYIDASHEQGDVLRDYEAYWEILKPGGAFLVDDLTNWFPGVLHDWDEFLNSRVPPLIPLAVEGEKGLLIKP